MIEGDTRKIGANKHEEALANTWNAERGIPDLPASLESREDDPSKTKQLLKTARECWDYLVPLMADEKLLAQVDQVALTILCLAFAGSVEALRACDFGNADKLMKHAMQCADRMGLNESARARLNRPKDKSEDPVQSQMAAFLKARKPA